MKIRTIKGPAGKGSITVKSVIADAIALRARRALKAAPRMRKSAEKALRERSKELGTGIAGNIKSK